MWYIIIYDMNGVEMARVPITEGAVVSIGSDPSSVLPMPGLAPAQAFLYLTEGYPVIEDGGTQSTMIDGFALVEPAYLTAESMIGFGPYTAYAWFDEAAFLPPGGYDPSSGFVPPPPDALPPPPPPPDMVAPVAAGYYPDPAAYPPAEQLQAGGGQIQINTGEHDIGPVVEPGPMQFGSDAQVIGKRQLKLIAREGYLDGREFVLAYDEAFDIGRAAIVEIVVDDPSVSRIHARMTLEEGGTLLVQDLRSTNGTYINGKEVTREHASVGDRIRLGEVPFYVAAVGESAAGGGARFSVAQYKKLVFTFIGILFFFGVIAVVKVARQKRFKPPVDPKTQQASYDDNIKARVARLKAEADELARMDEWDESVAKYRESLSLVPDDTDIKEKLNQALFEKRNYAIFKEALEFKNRMTHDMRIKALERFSAIDKKSQYYRADISPLIVELKQELARHYRDEGTMLFKAQQYPQAHELLCQYFELDSKLDDLKGEEQVRLDLQHSEKVLKNRKDFVACESMRFLEARIPVDEMWAKQAKEAIYKKYPEGIADQVLTYFIGDPKNAMFGLEELVKNPKYKKKFAAHTQLIIELQGQLRSVVQGYESGETKLQSGDADAARTEWSVVLTVDKTIIPEGFKSRYSRNIGNRLSKSYYLDGRKSLDLYRYEEAFDYFKKGMDLDPDDTTELLEGFKELEQQAGIFLDEAVQLNDSGSIDAAKKIFLRITKITLENSPTHQKAKSFLK
ncbi:FHA domain-containing protein [Myxococcota bacterium]|nr:FHA domain-containing protein [Myxococcota bacterium]